MMTYYYINNYKSLLILLLVLNIYWLLLCITYLLFLCYT